MKYRSFSLSIACVALLLMANSVLAEVLDTAVRETILRLKAEQSEEVLLSLDSEKLLALLTEQERKTYSEKHITFSVDVPVKVYLVLEPEILKETFWLEKRGFSPTLLPITINDKERVVWTKDFPAGPVALGVTSLNDSGDHYFAIIVPQQTADTVILNDISPVQYHSVGVAEKGEYVLTDEDDELIVALPDQLEGHVLLRGHGKREEEAAIAHFFRKTPHPATPIPDQIILTLGEDPATTMTVQWRTSAEVKEGIVKYQKKAALNNFDPAPPLKMTADTMEMEDLGLVSNPFIHKHFAALTGLAPATTYLYSVGTGDTWSTFGEFTTAPQEASGFSFVYMGDIQNGYNRWASLKRRAELVCPDAMFCITAGDQVNRGGFRDDWDNFYHNVGDYFSNLPIVPTIGNHEMHRGAPELYLAQFHLPHNGPNYLTPERAYSVTYGHVLIVSLDANLPVNSQTPWLEKTLKESDAIWKFVLFHQPAYSSKPNRDNPEIRMLWGDIFEKYQVDIAFQGHDHGYLRSFPMKNGKKVAAGEKGTIYLVTVAGTKAYPVSARDYGAKIMEKTATFQTIDIMTIPHRLLYRAYNVDGDILDEFELTK